MWSMFTGLWKSARQWDNEGAIVTENNKSGHTRVSVQSVMEEICAEVARKRQENEYPEEWFEIADTDADDPERRDDLEANLRRANETVLFDRAQAFPEGSAGERAAGFVKGAIRRAILFHTNYLADQADKHNAAVVRTLNKLHQAVEELRRRSANTESVAVEFGQRLGDLGDADLVKRVEAIERSLREKGLLS